MIDIVMTTYFPPDVPSRVHCFSSAVHSLASYLMFPEEYRLVITDDGSPSDIDFKRYSHSWMGPKITLLGEHGGIGSSINRAMSQVNDLWLYTTDDWVLKDVFALHQACRLIREHGYDYVRVGFPHSDVSCKTRHYDGMWWLHVNHYRQPGFAFATRPFLATRAFYDKVGKYPEHCNVYDAEIQYANRVRNTRNLKLAFMSLTGYPWVHIGDDAQVGHYGAD